jgi:hypothetical protein
VTVWRNGNGALRKRKERHICGRIAKRRKDWTSRGAGQYRRRLLFAALRWSGELPGCNTPLTLQRRPQCRHRADPSRKRIAHLLISACGEDELRPWI